MAWTSGRWRSYDGEWKALQLCVFKGRGKSGTEAGPSCPLMRPFLALSFQDLNAKHDALGSEKGIFWKRVAIAWSPYGAPKPQKCILKSEKCPFGPPQRILDILMGEAFYLQLELFLLTVKLLCLQSLKALIRRAFPL